MSDDETTIGRRPLPHRPKNGLLAWEATMGYISAHHSPDAMLKLQIYPYQDGVRWAASASWSQNEETVGDKDSVAAALRDLWRVLSMHHTIFKSTEAASRRPIDYDEWLDTSTTASIGRLIDVARAVYDDDWLIIIIYQPVENPQPNARAGPASGGKQQYQHRRTRAGHARRLPHALPEHCSPLCRAPTQKRRLITLQSKENL